MVISLDAELRTHQAVQLNFVASQVLVCRVHQIALTTPVSQWIKVVSENVYITLVDAKRIHPRIYTACLITMIHTVHIKIAYLVVFQTFKGGSEIDWIVNIVTQTSVASERFIIYAAICNI